MSPLIDIGIDVTPIYLAQFSRINKLHGRHTLALSIIIFETAVKTEFLRL